MDEFSPKKADKILSDTNQKPDSLFAKLNQLAELNKRVSALLDPAIAKFCQVANVHKNELVFLAANSSISTLILFQAQDLLRRFRQDAKLRNIQKISTIVRPDNTQSQRSDNGKQDKMQGISAENAAIIRRMASTLDDPALREVMEKIASHTD